MAKAHMKEQKLYAFYDFLSIADIKTKTVMIIP
jgi:hypothetical protein